MSGRAIRDPPQCTRLRYVQWLPRVVSAVSAGTAGPGAPKPNFLVIFVGASRPCSSRVPHLAHVHLIHSLTHPAAARNQMTWASTRSRCRPRSGITVTQATTTRSARPTHVLHRGARVPELVLRVPHLLAIARGDDDRAAADPLGRGPGRVLRQRRGRTAAQRDHIGRSAAAARVSHVHDWQGECAVFRSRRPA